MCLSVSVSLGRKIHNRVFTAYPGWPENGAGPRKFGPPVGKEPSLGGPTHAGLGPPLPLAYGSFLDVETPPGPKGAPGPGPKPGP